MLTLARLHVGAVKENDKTLTDIPAMVFLHGQLVESSCSLGLEQTKRPSLEEWEECVLFYATLFSFFDM